MHALQRLTAIFLCTTVGWRGLRVAAQIIYPQCSNTTNMQWSFNNKTQSPCQVGATLEGACYDNRWNLSPVAPGQEYGGPNSPVNTNFCQCNTVAYSLISACGFCQGAPFPSWLQWRRNCSDGNVTLSDFPLPIPSGTSVPPWAYLDVRITGSWNLDAALANASAYSTRPPTTTTTTTPSITSTTTGSGSIPTAVNGNNTTSSSSKAGPIAGGVVGGVVGLAALVLVGFLLYRRRHRSGHPTQHNDEKVAISDAASPVSGPGPGPGSDYYGHIRSPSDDPPKIYNPSDPSTFPPSLPPMPPGYTPQSPIGSTFSGQTASTNTWAPLGYKGAPEV